MFARQPVRHAARARGVERRVWSVPVYDVLQSSYGSGRQPKYLSVRRLIGRSDRKILWLLSLVQKWDGKDV